MSILEPSKIPTLQDVARLAGVSVPTASLALNDLGTIAKSTRFRVKAVAKELNYQANPFARSWRMKRSHAFGVLWCFSTPHTVGGLVTTFSQQAVKHHHTALIYDSLADPKALKSQLGQLIELRADGAIVQITPELDLEEFLPLFSALPHVVLVPEEPLNSPYAQVIHSRSSAMKMAASHLLSAGRKRLAFIGVISNAGPKYRPVEDIVNKTTIDGVVPLALLNTPNPYNPSVDELLSLLLRQSKLAFDGILCANDELAARVIYALRTVGLQVGSDFSIIGFNDSPIAELFAPAIASVVRKDTNVAIRAVERLIANIEGLTGAGIHSETIEMEFVLRESAGAIAGCP